MTCFRCIAGIFGIVATSCGLLNAGVTTIYPFPVSMPADDKFEVQVDGQKLHIWKVDGDKPVANFAYENSVVVKVKYAAPFTKAEIWPKGYNIKTKTLSGTEVEFVLDDIQKSRVILRLDDDFTKEIFVFGDPPVPPVPAGAKVYEAGKHDFANNTLDINSNETLYLKPGAVLHARVNIPNKTSNVHIVGRGIIKAYFKGRFMHQFRIGDECSNITIDGIILTNNDFPDYTPSEGWYLDLHQLVIRGNHSHDIVVNNFKAIADYYTSDAIALGGCSKVNVQDCFLMSADNAIVPGWTGVTEDVTMFRTVIYQTRGGYSAAIFPQGSSNSDVTAEIKNFHIKDLYIVQTMGTLVGCNFGNSFTGISNFVIENVEIDRLHIHDAGGTNEWARSRNNDRFIKLSKSPSATAELLLKNVQWIEDKEIEGNLSANWKVTFDNVSYKGRLINSVADANLELNGGQLVIKNSGAVDIRMTTGHATAQPEWSTAVKVSVAIPGRIHIRKQDAVYNLSGRKAASYRNMSPRKGTSNERHD